MESMLALDNKMSGQSENAEPRAEQGVQAVAHTVVNKIATLLINVCTGVLTARVLKPAGRGELAAMIVWPLLLTSVTTLGIPSAIIYVLRQKKQAAGEYIATGFVMTLVLGVSASLAGAVFLPLWLGRQYSPGVIHAAQWFLVVTPILALTQAGRVVLEAKSQFSLSNKLMVLSPATTLVGLLLLLGMHLLTPFTAGISYMAGAIPSFFLAIVWVLPLVGEGLRVRIGAARELLSYGIRSFGVDLLGTLALQVDQVLVISMLPPSAMGSYGVILSLSRMFNLFQGSVVMVLFPKATGQPTERVLELTERAARISTMITACCCVIVSIFGFTLLRLLYGKEYSGAAGSLRLLLIEVTISGAVFILAQAFMALGHPGVVSILQGIGLSLSIPLMLWLVPRMGVKGAAVSLLISTLARFVFVYCGFRFILKVRMPQLLPTREDLRLVASTFRKLSLRAS